jgi:HK97 family phage prohead protease
LLDSYKANPVFQNSHQYGDIIFTIGRTEEIEVRADLLGNNYLYQRVRFAVEENPFAKVAYELYRGGFLNAVSVGFKPIKWVDGEKVTPARRVFIEQELIEVSAVSIPANQNALAIAAKNGTLNLRILDECVERLIPIIDAYKRDHQKKTFRIRINQLDRDNLKPSVDSTRLCALFNALRGAVGKIKR